MKSKFKLITIAFTTITALILLSAILLGIYYYTESYKMQSGAELFGVLLAIIITSISAICAITAITSIYLNLRYFFAFENPTPEKTLFNFATLVISLLLITSVCAVLCGSVSAEIIMLISFGLLAVIRIAQLVIYLSKKLVRKFKNSYETV